MNLYCKALWVVSVNTLHLLFRFALCFFSPAKATRLGRNVLSRLLMFTSGLSSSSTRLNPVALRRNGRSRWDKIRCKWNRRYLRVYQRHLVSVKNLMLCHVAVRWNSLGCLSQRSIFYLAGNRDAAFRLDKNALMKTAWCPAHHRWMTEHRCDNYIFSNKPVLSDQCISFIFAPCCCSHWACRWGIRSTAHQSDQSCGSSSRLLQGHAAHSWKTLHSGTQSSSLSIHHR